MELTVMTFNLRVDLLQDGDNAWSFRAESAAQLIEQSSAAVVCTQEGLYPVLLDLNKRLRYEWVGQGRLGGYEDEFCAVFYRPEVLRAIECDHFALSENTKRFGDKSWGAGYPRMCTVVRFQFIDQPEKQFIVMNTHLDNESIEAQEQGISLIWKELQALRYQSGLPVILTGDLNSPPESRVVQFLRGKEKLGSSLAELRDAYSALSKEKSVIGSTYHGFAGGSEGSPIDYIFTTHDIELQGTYIDRRKLNGKHASDHYPVIAKLKFH